MKYHKPEKQMFSLQKRGDLLEVILTYLPKTKLIVYVQAAHIGR